MNEFLHITSQNNEQSSLIYIQKKILAVDSIWSLRECVLCGPRLFLRKLCNLPVRLSAQIYYNL